MVEWGARVGGREGISNAKHEEALGKNGTKDWMGVNLKKRRKIKRL